MANGKPNVFDFVVAPYLAIMNLHLYRLSHLDSDKNIKYIHVLKIRRIIFSLSLLMAQFRYRRWCVRAMPTEKPIAFHIRHNRTNVIREFLESVRFVCVASVTRVGLCQFRGLEIRRLSSIAYKFNQILQFINWPNAKQ